jgi:hypothetical protein
METYKLYCRYEFKKTFKGKNKKDFNSNGSSMLFLLKNDKYLYIGNNEVYIFQPNDRIISLNSKVVNGITWPYAIGEKYIYLMYEAHVYADKKDLKDIQKHVIKTTEFIKYAKDPYAEYYKLLDHVEGTKHVKFCKFKVSKV